VNIVILTGAGISAESGLGTFRDEEGLWAQHDIRDVATPEAFRRNPDLVHRFYNARRSNAAAAQPNAAHRALARLEAEHDAGVVVITQNVDDLHERGGSKSVIHMHGTLTSALCARCDHRWPAPLVMATDDRCPACDAEATRPDIVWFGEMPYAMDLIADLLASADLFVSIGTSGNVYPAAGFVAQVRLIGARSLELNLEASGGAFDASRLGLASDLVPRWVDEILS
jgi:NAD-dependent deacetylase